MPRSMTERWKQSLFTAFLMVVVGHGSAQAAFEEWSNAGLYGGDAVLVTYNPGNGWLYTGNGQQGLLRRTVGQSSWQEAGGAAGAFMADLAIDPTDASTLYMAARVLGIFKSTDNAATFSPATTGLIGMPEILRIAAAPSAPGTLYAGDSSGQVWKSIDSAATWSLTSLAAGSNIFSLAVHPTDADIVFAGTAFTGVSFTNDGGATWSDRSTGLNSTSINALVFDPNDASRVYIAVASQGLMIGDNLAVAGWVESHPDTAFGSFGRAITVAPTTPTTIYYGTLGEMYRSSDAGATWTETTGELAAREAQSLAVDPSDPTQVWIATVLGGVFRSTDSGDTWSNWNVGIEVQRVRAIEADSQNEGRFWAATGGGLARTTDGGAAWEIHRGMFWLSYALRALGVAPSDPDTLYVKVNPGRPERSTDGGTTFAPAGTSACQAAAWDIAIHPTNPLIVYLVDPNGLVCKSTDGGLTWPTSANGIAAGSAPRSVVIDPNAPDVLYITTFNSGLFKSSDAAANWQPINNGVGALNTLSSVCVDPTDGQRLYAVGSGRVLRSVDAGDSWQLATPDAAIRYDACEVGPMGEVVVGGYQGFNHRMFYSTDHAATWEDLGGIEPPQGGFGFGPGRTVTDIRFDPSNRARILVGILFYGVAEYTLGGPIFDDGFESGDTDRWSAATP